MLALAAWGLSRHAQPHRRPLFYLRWLPLAIALPYLANSTGWIMTEMGRQPWIVFGLSTAAGISTSVGLADRLHPPVYACSPR